MIETGEFNMTQISYMVGINDPRYFSKCFQGAGGDDTNWSIKRKWGDNTSLGTEFFLHVKILKRSLHSDEVTSLFSIYVVRDLWQPARVTKTITLIKFISDSEISLIRVGERIVLKNISFCVEARYCCVRIAFSQ